MGLILLDGSSLLELGREKFRNMFGELGVNALLKERVIAVTWEDTLGERELFRALREMGHEWDRLPVLVIIITETPLRPVIPGSAQVPAVFEIREPDPFARKDMGMRYAKKWQIPFEDGFGEMWQRFRFTPGQFQNVLEQAKDMAFARNAEIPSREELRIACRRQAEYRFHGKAVLIRPQFVWEDLVLPEASKKLLQDICSRSRNQELVYGTWEFSSRFPYGLGTSILFTGSPGTGKTMAAQVMANELGMPLYRVDLSQLISKYIGETQKNIGRIFEEADKCDCILLFDEADAIFTKRSDVSDAQDRYSNAETAYLLQRIEQYSGVSILATNLLQNFDDAFRRRISYMVHFPMPDAALRKELWESIFPKDTPVAGEVDALMLAQAFELSGASIKNAALHGALLAASEGVPVGMKHLLGGIENEYGKQGKNFSTSQRELLEAFL